jgi:hypothetical protein
MRRRVIVGGMVLAMVVGMLSMVALAEVDETGNGAPSGEHFTLNIIGVGSDKSPNMDGGGHVIFVAIDDTTEINLSMGDDFAVLDKNGTDGEAAFQLPDPDLDPYVVGDKGDADTDSAYSVFVRPLGKPGGFATITTCAEVVESELADFLSKKDLKLLSSYSGAQASVEQVGQEITERKKGKSEFTNVTAELLTIVLVVEVEVLEDGEPTGETYYIYVRVPIFDDILNGEYWEYDNDGLKVLQARFYPNVSTDVSEGDGDLPAL